MPVSSPVSIALSKRKLTYSLLGAFVFMALGLWFSLRPTDWLGNPFLHTPGWIRAFGLLALTFFGILAFFVLKKMRDPNPGLVVTAEGLVDNASGLVGGLIPWADVAGIRELELMGQKMVMVMLRDPEAYISRQPNPFKRQLMNTNFKSYGSPINISANALEYSYPELLALLTTRLTAYRASK
ncbi:STM3941 family protein [Hymenobacter ruricola]|uniref:Uncharacterized protein n=1 Tax=Hymenobacter ruricola TaxID=2791023 RepID=A0ABS0HY56_9BACT|nr:STM3941 family protein [Hymenobacter ruricola]MBF9219639.1 hypothetical protein [Hymenobacter ruricola]